MKSYYWFENARTVVQTPPLTFSFLIILINIWLSEHYLIINRKILNNIFFCCMIRLFVCRSLDCMEEHSLVLPTGLQEGLVLLLPHLSHLSNQCPYQALEIVPFLHSAPLMMVILLNEILLKHHLRTFSYTGNPNVTFL